MNLEGANGKNPVYHVGKLYNVAAQRLAARLHEATGEHAEVHLVSTTGQRLDEPWRILVRLASEDVEVDKVQALVAEAMDAFPALTDELVSDGMALA
jgi:S-adenosylmethionine synthetase